MICSRLLHSLTIFCRRPLPSTERMSAGSIVHCAGNNCDSDICADVESKDTECVSTRQSAFRVPAGCGRCGRCYTYGKHWPFFIPYNAADAVLRWHMLSEPLRFHAVVRGLGSLCALCGQCGHLRSTRMGRFHGALCCFVSSNNDYNNCGFGRVPRINNTTRTRLGAKSRVSS